MTRLEFLTRVKDLGFDLSDYIVIGAGTLCALNIREAHDIDVIVTPDIFNKLESTGQWVRKEFNDGTHYLIKDDVEVGLDWASPDLKPNLRDLKKDEIIIEGVPFTNLDRVRKWKLWKGTPKHIADVKLIDNYLKENS